MRLNGSISVLLSCVVTFFWVQASAVQNVSLTWDASPDKNVVSYVVYYGMTSRNYSNVRYVGNATNVTITGVPEEATCYFAVTAQDAAGLESELSNEVAHFVPTIATPTTARPTLRINGQGAISPDYSLRDLGIGKNYTVIAVPGTGQVFANWNGYTNSASTRVTFCMKPGLTLEAKFIPSPFIPVAGSYTGLFYESNTIQQTSSGMFSIAATRYGTYSGRIQIGNGRYSFSGRLNLDCQATNLILRTGSTPLALAFRLGSGDDADQVFGQLSDGVWTAALLGDRAVFNALTNLAPYAGIYNLVLPGKPGDESFPAGDSYGSLRISTAGKVSFSGMLADNSRMSQSVSISKDGHWPVYIPLYAGQGSLLSWFKVENRTNDDINGLLSWIRPADVAAKYYPRGFTNVLNAVGSAYVAPLGDTNSTVSFTNGLVSFCGGDLVTSFTNAVTLGLKDRVTNLGSNTLSLTFSRASGKFSGRVKEPLTGVSWYFRGAVLQKGNIGCGHLLTSNQTSQVTFTP